ncbi:MAG: TRAP transporter TatT component family protein [Gammaproteobacteria bacterium]|nr:TRAP transporter TatT component family protein [Gammaproteobacteria bacterium]
MADGLTLAILNQDDPQTVQDGAPAYLLLMDGLIQSDPEDADSLLAGARLYGAYASIFVKDNARNKRLSSRARDYSRRALCEELDNLCAVLDSPYDVFKAKLNEIDDDDDVPLLHTFAVIWVAWIKAHKDDWAAVADLAKVKACMEKVIELDEKYDSGSAHLYMGLMNTLLPAALGGKPEEAKKSFLRAIELSQGRDLMRKVHYAERYARLVFNQKLHDRLLNTVINAQPNEPGLTLLNIMAQQRAKELLKSGKDYF